MAFQSRFLALVAGCLVSGSFCLTSRAETDPTVWQRQSIYQLITDRFFDGTSTNNNLEGTFNASTSGGSHGGDFRGIEAKLDYIQALGCTAIWLSPVMLNAYGEFHGYAARDFYAVAPKWGTLADLKQFTAAAHARGMLVIQDVVVNHGGDLVYSTDSGYSAFRTPPSGYTLRYRNTSRTYAPPFNVSGTNTLNTLFHNNGNINDFNSVTQTERGELVGLDDFNTESPFVRARMAEIFQYWIREAGFDGFRIDTAKHVEMGFWQEWCPQIRSFAETNGRPNFFMFGEVYDGSDVRCGSYTGTQAGGAFAMESVLDYPLYFATKDVFALANSNTKRIQDRYSTLASNYAPGARDRLVTFLDNHDQARFLAPSQANNNTNRLKNALVFLYTSRGIPCLYYGTEQAFNGETDPNDREDMFDGQFEQGPSEGDNFNYCHDLFQWVARLNNFRRLYPALTIGTHVDMWSSSTGAGLLAYARRLGGTQEVFTAINTAVGAQTLPARGTIYPTGSVLVNLLNTNETLVVEAGPQIPSFTVPGASAKIFLNRNQWLPLDPVVTNTVPGHDSSNRATTAPIILEFSEPMETNSVQIAFSTLPPVPGSFSWSQGLNILTFTPSGSGFPTQALVTVRVSANALVAGSGRRLFAGFESRFKTGTNVSFDVTPPRVTISTPLSNAVVSGVLVASGSAADNSLLQKVQVRTDSGQWQDATGSSSWSFSLNTSNLVNGLRHISARALDTAGNSSPIALVTVRVVNVPGDYSARISAGNPGDVTDCTGQVWVADRPYSAGSFGYEGGAAGYLNSTVTGICASAQSLYQRERYGSFLYRFDCPPALYQITLAEAETWFSSAGQRIFDILVEGNLVVNDVDILARAGGKNLPLTLLLTNTCSDGALDVTFVPELDNARISGLQVRKIADAVSDPDGLPDWWRLAWFDHPTGQASDLSRAEDDADGDGASNRSEFLVGTNPIDSQSLFRLLTPHLLGNDNLSLSWPTLSNRMYQLQQRSPMPAGNWSNTGAAMAGNNSVITQVVSLSGSSSLFRVEVR